MPAYPADVAEARADSDASVRLATSVARPEPGSQHPVALGTRYRYVLRRRWRSGGPTLLVVGLNPSTADAKVDDPTTAMVTRLCRRHGYGGFELVNVFAARATMPRDLASVADPIGPKNDSWIATAVRRTDATLVAWGSSGTRLPAFAHRVASVVALLSGRPMLCQGSTKSGHPRHPLYNREELRTWSAMPEA